MRTGYTYILDPRHYILSLRLIKSKKLSDY